MTWATPFYEPIQAGRKTLKTLGDARAFVLKLPKKDRDREPWQVAAQTLLLGATHNTSQLAEVAVRSAINGPQPEPDFDKPGRKEQRWGKAKKDPWR
jgi:hypothetical protein